MSIILIIILLTLMGISYKFTKNIFHPMTFYIFYWSLFIIFGYITFQEYNWNNSGNVYIIITMILFIIGYIMSKSLLKTKMIKPIKSNIKYNKTVVNIILIVVTIIIFIKPLMLLRDYNENLKVFFNLKKLLELNNIIAKDRYDATSSMVTTGVLSNIVLVIYYLGPLLSGYVFSKSKSNKEKLLSLIPFIPVIMNLLLDNGKVGLIYSIFLFSSSYFVTYLSDNKKNPNIKKYRFIFTIFLVSLLLFITFILRIGSINLEVIQIAFNKFKIYAFGNMESFDNWFTNYRSLDSSTYGKYTFYSVFNLLGISIRNQGVYEFLPGSTSNIFTVFRGLITDFNLIGSLVFIYIMAFYSSYLYDMIKNGNKKIFFRVILMLNYYFILTSFLISSLTYSSVLLAFILFYFILFFLERYTIKI